MNHFLLPRGAGQGSGDMRYGVHSMELLINDLLKQGAQRGRLTAQVYGGASVIQNQSNIGKSNAEFATSFLQREGIPILKQDLGGKQARRLKFQASSGNVQNLVVPPTNDLMQPARPKPKPAPQPDVTLF
jgi:chemotaxis protein CheD